MAEQAALHSRSAAATVLTETVRELKRYREKGVFSQRILQGDSSVTCVTSEGENLSHICPHSRPSARSENKNLVNYY